jgi:DNA-binding XRE family transcriptional regulator
MSDASWSATILANSIKRVRRLRGYTQAQLAEMIGTTQADVSRMEDPTYRGWSCRSLIKVAVALRARLRVQFIPKEERATKDRDA